MVGLVAGFAVLAVLALLGALAPEVPLATENAASVAANFLVYRQAVAVHYAANPGAGPVVADGTLPLPASYRELRDWRNLRSAGGPVFAYGASDAELIAALADHYWRRTAALGRVEAGRLVSPVHGDLGVAVPATVPAGSLAALVHVN